MPKPNRNTNRRRDELEPSSQKKDVLSVGKDNMPYPHVIVNCTVELKRLEPDMLEGLLPQSQKLQKEVSSTTPKKKRKQDNRKINKVYRKDMTSGFLLLRECVPGIEKFNRAGMLMSTAKYIIELQNKVRELENCIEKRNTTPLPMESNQPFSTPTDCDRSTGMKRDSVPKITLRYYPVPSTATEQESDCTDKHSAPIVTEPKMPDPSQMVTGLSSLMADYSDISEPNSPTGQMVTDILEMADLTPVSTPMEDHSSVPVEMEVTSDEIAEWFAVNSEEEEEEEELPEFNSVEELKQWLGL
jgi:hypothetical protein